MHHNLLNQFQVQTQSKLLVFLKSSSSAKEFPLLHKVSRSTGLIFNAASKHFIASLCFDFPAKTIPLLLRTTTSFGMIFNALS